MVRIIIRGRSELLKLPLSKLESLRDSVILSRYFEDLAYAIEVKDTLKTDKIRSLGG